MWKTKLLSLVTWLGGPAVLVAGVWAFINSELPSRIWPPRPSWVDANTQPCRKTCEDKKLEPVKLGFASGANLVLCIGRIAGETGFRGGSQGPDQKQCGLDSGGAIRSSSDYRCLCVADNKLDYPR